MFSILEMLINLLYYVVVGFLLARAVMSWVRPDPYDPRWGPIMRFVHQVTEPVLAPVRSRLPQTGMMDFSPLVVWVIAWFLRGVLTSIL